MWLVASVHGSNRGRRLRMNKPFWCWHATMPRSCPYVLFSYYSYICAFCPFIALYSPLIFLQQRLLESLIRAKKWGVIASSLHFLICLVPKLCKNRFAHSMFTLSFMFLLSYSMPWFCSRSWFILFWILGSLLIVMALLLLFVRGLISLLFLQFHCLTLCMMYALFVIHLIYT